jgi:hypothetical protein
VVSGGGYLYYKAWHSNLFLNRNTGRLMGGQELMIMKELYRGVEIITPAIQYINSCRVKQKNTRCLPGRYLPASGVLYPVMWGYGMAEIINII